MNEEHFRRLERMYLSAKFNEIYKPELSITEGEAEVSFEAGPHLHHAGNAVHGSNYFKALDDAAFETMAGVKLWIVDCLRDRPHPTHSHVAQTLEWIERLKPERAILTHLNQEVDYQDLKDRCPPGVEPGYDGMVIELDD